MQKLLARSFLPRLSRLSRLSLLPTLLIVPLLLAACGGGGASDPTALPSGKDSTSAAAAGASRTASVNGVEAWTLCASEGQTCQFSGTRSVRYGTAKQTVTAMFTNEVSCTNDVFGDPAYGIGKSCWYSSESGTTAPPTWVTCAGENQFCAFSGTRAVRYGSEPSFFYGTFKNGVQCSFTVFGDPAYGISKTCSYSATEMAADPAPVDPVGSSGTNPPIVLNASSSGRAGHVVSLQGDGFGANPRVYFEAAPAVPLEIVNRVGTIWLAVQIPSDAPKALILRVSNGTGTSARIVLNGARPLHLDAMQLVPGGAFRMFGRSLMHDGSTPTVTIDGAAATVDIANSDEYMLTVTAPLSLSATTAARVVVDNGNGTGPTQLDRTIEVVASGTGDPFGLGVGWAAAFGAIMNTSVDAASDPRLSERAVCNGTDNDAGAIRAAIDLAGSLGGGVVRLPAGRCRLGYGIELRSRVVVQGAGKDATELVYESNFPVYGMTVDLSGLRNLTLTNAGSSTEGMLIKNSTRLFIQNVRVQVGTSRQMYLTGNRHFVVMGSDFIQSGSISEQGPYNLSDSAGLVFEGNSTRWVNGAPTFGRIHDSFIHANRFTRDGQAQNTGGVVHSLTIDFAHRIAVVANNFDVANGPISNVQRNDGETILTEGGGASRTENLGTVASATANSISDPTNSINVDPFGTGAIPENYGVAIVGGRGAGQTRHVVAASGSTLIVDRAWEIVPDSSSRYATFVWGLEMSLIKGNVLSQNPRGIWLYQTAIRDVDVIGNIITEGGGIFLRVYQNLANRSFTPIFNVVISGNKIANSNGRWMSYLNATFVNTDARAFGIAMLGIEMRSNEITANQPNVTSALEDYAGTEGFLNQMRVENYSGYESDMVPRLLGSILTGNLCTNCDVAVRIGTGAGGTTVLNTRLVNTPTLITDTPTTSSSERSTDSVVR